MEEKILELYEIVRDYRENDNLMSPEIIREWIAQFDEADRDFFLGETIHLMKRRYISKSIALEFLKVRIPYLAEKSGYATPQNFLRDVVIIDNQPNEKSQKILLQMFYDISLNEYGIDLRTLKPKNAKNYLYIDDVLCTDDTLYKSLTGPIEKEFSGFLYDKDEEGNVNISEIKKNGAVIRLIYFCIHQKNIQKVIDRIDIKINKHPEPDLRTSINYNYSYLKSLFVDNRSSSDSKMDLVVTCDQLRVGNILNCEEQITEKLSISPFYKKKNFFYRDVNNPVEEILYSNNENRNRYEQILINKCVEIYYRSENLMNNLRPRPLGYGLNYDDSLGFGAIIFTWRNAPYNTPLVFWYRGFSWAPLFERNHT